MVAVARVTCWPQRVQLGGFQDGHGGAASSWSDLGHHWSLQAGPPTTHHGHLCLRLTTHMPGCQAQALPAARQPRAPAGRTVTTRATLSARPQQRRNSVERELPRFSGTAQRRLEPPLMREPGDAWRGVVRPPHPARPPTCQVCTGAWADGGELLAFERLKSQALGPGLPP